LPVWRFDIQSNIIVFFTHVKIYPPAAKTVLEIVLASDEERNALPREEKDLLGQLVQQRTDAEAQDPTSDNDDKNDEPTKENEDEFKEKMNQLNVVYSRLKLLSSDTTASRLTQILSRLQFTKKKQHGVIENLSGGW